MPDLRSQKQMAARILTCGVTRVRIDPRRIADVADAITAADVRRYIKDGVITAAPKKGVSSFRSKKIAAQKAKGRRRGPGSRKGHASGVRKRAWIARIRAIRKLLREFKTAKRIDNRTYRDLYTKSRSGFFRSRSHVMIHLEREGLLKEGSETKGQENPPQNKGP